MKIKPFNKEDILTKISNSFDPLYNKEDVDDVMQFLRELNFETENISFDCAEMRVFKDGIFVYNIIKQLEASSNDLPPIDFYPRTPIAAVNNYRQIIKMLSSKKKNFNSFFLNKERELYIAKPSMIISFLKHLKEIYKNEFRYFLRLNDSKSKVKKIRVKNMDKSERNHVPLTSEMRSRFLVADNKRMWAQTIDVNRCKYIMLFY